MRPYNPHYPTMLREKIKYNRDSACDYNRGFMNGFDNSMYYLHIKDMRKEENKLKKYLSKYFKRSGK